MYMLRSDQAVRLLDFVCFSHTFQIFMNGLASKRRQFLEILSLYVFTE